MMRGLEDGELGLTWHGIPEGLREEASRLSRSLGHLKAVGVELYGMRGDAWPEDVMLAVESLQKRVVHLNLQARAWSLEG